MNQIASRLLLTTLATPLLAAEESAFSLRSGPRQTALVELFTSEGCSSCPPAEQWLGEFADKPALWRDFVPVVWHVDYWDGLGWPDRFASKANTQRQENYSVAWRSPSIYTPGFVMNGAEWRGWNRPVDFAKSAKASAGVLEVKGSGTNQFTVTFAPPATDKGQFDVNLAWLGSNLVSDVKRGENAGRKLRHNFVVLKTVVAKLKPEAGNFTVTVSLPQPAERDSERLALAAWVSLRGQLPPVQAVGGWWLSRTPARNAAAP